MGKLWTLIIQLHSIAGYAFFVNLFYAHDLRYYYISFGFGLIPVCIRIYILNYY